MIQELLQSSRWKLLDIIILDVIIGTTWVIGTFLENYQYDNNDGPRIELQKCCVAKKVTF